MVTVTASSIIEGATVRVFRVPNVGAVCVEIGDGITGPTGRTYPAYRVSIDEKVVAVGTDWGVPADAVTDSVDSMLELLFWVARDTDNEALEVWRSARVVLRHELRRGTQRHEALVAVRNPR